jgi:hypothetical protein
VNECEPLLGGDSFQTRLSAMTPEEGINLEIDRFTAGAYTRSR